MRYVERIRPAANPYPNSAIRVVIASVEILESDRDCTSSRSFQMVYCLWPAEEDAAWLAPVFEDLRIEAREKLARSASGPGPGPAVPVRRILMSLDQPRTGD